MRYADEVNYKCRLKKDGTFELSFVALVPSEFWRTVVKKKFGRREPPKAVPFDPRHFDVLVQNKDFQRILQKIREDVSRRFGREVVFGGLHVTDGEIWREKDEYYVKVVTVGVWSEAE